VKRKTLLVLAAAVAVVIAAGLAVLVAPIAQGTTVATNPNQRIAKLEAQMKVVQIDLKSAKADLKTAKADLKTAKADLKSAKADLKSANATIARLNASVEAVSGLVNTATGAIKCLSFGAVPIGQYGGPSPAPHGYLYTNDGSTTVITTGLDLVPAGTAPGAYVAAVDPACIKTSSAARATSDAAGRQARPMTLTGLRLPH
jgi:multidrug efflux pump subunit AcrA (membrane-fusion protein)